MKRTILNIAAIIALVSTASCNKLVNPGEEVNSGEVVFTATIDEEDSKTFIEQLGHNLGNLPRGPKPNYLPGRFSVSSSHQVNFAKGNLTYDGSSFKFEDNQHGYPTSWDPNHIGHFFWSKDEWNYLLRERTVNGGRGKGHSYDISKNFRNRTDEKIERH